MGQTRRALISAASLIMFALVSCTAAPDKRVASTSDMPVAANSLNTSLAATLNKPVMVEFYSTMCSICKQIKPAVIKLEEEYKDRVEFKEYDAAGINEEIRQQYKYVGYPQFVILSTQGEIRFNRFGFQTYESLKSDLESVLSGR